MKVSVIVPVYNVQNYIHYALESLLAQTYTDYEVILSMTVYRRFGSLVRSMSAMTMFTLCQGQAAPPDARNYGVAKAQAEWVTFLIRPFVSRTACL